MARPKKVNTEETSSAATATPSIAATPEKVDTPENLPTADTSLQARNAVLSEQNELLKAALAMGRVPIPPVSNAADDEIVRVTNLGGSALVFNVSDSRSGLPRHVTLDRRGAWVDITKAQLQDLQERHPHFVNDGHLSCDALADNPNTIRNFEAFIKALDAEAVDSRINQITSTAVLIDLYHHLESQRFEHQDSSGKPHTMTVGDEVRLTVKEKPLSVKKMVVERAVQRRVGELMGIHLGIDG